MEVLGRIPFLSIFRKFSTQITFMPKTLHTLIKQFHFLKLTPMVRLETAPTEWDQVNLVLPEDSIVEGLLGLNFLQYFDIKISFSTGTIEIYPK